MPTLLELLHRVQLMYLCGNAAGKERHICCCLFAELARYGRYDEWQYDLCRRFDSLIGDAFYHVFGTPMHSGVDTVDQRTGGVLRGLRREDDGLVSADAYLIRLRILRWMIDEEERRERV